MSSIATNAGVVSFEEARRIVEEHAAGVLAGRGAGIAETVELPAARGRVLAEEILADRDFPPFHRAARDGYAVRVADVQQVPARLEVVGEIKAGDTRQSGNGALTIKPGQAASIMTGAPLPDGADAVVMVEHTRELPGTGRFVEVQQSVKRGENFVPRGSEGRAGQVVAEPGRRVNHALIAIAAAVGKSRVRVFQKPRVAVLSTGDEVVEVDAIPGPVQIRNSNSYSVAAQIEEAGGEAVRLPVAPDEPVRLRELILEGLSCDLLLLTGGVSMGKYDLVERVLSELKAEFYFTGAKIQPGKPIVFGRCGAETFGGTDRFSAAGARNRVSAPHYFFGLPGNPVSTMVTFRLFAQPMVEALAGARPEPLIFLKARLKSEVCTKTGLTRFLPAALSGQAENTEVERAPWQGSGDIAALAYANCYLVIPPDRERIEAGEWVSVLLP